MTPAYPPQMQSHPQAAYSQQKYIPRAGAAKGLGRGTPYQGRGGGGRGGYPPAGGGRGALAQEAQTPPPPPPPHIPQMVQIQEDAVSKLGASDPP